MVIRVVRPTVGWDMNNMRASCAQLGIGWITLTCYEVTETSKDSIAYIFIIPLMSPLITPNILVKRPKSSRLILLNIIIK
jgi:hypothetical protein